MSDIEIDLDDVERRMDGALASLKAEFSSLRTGRASATILEPVMVDAYGSVMPLNQCGTVNVPDPRMITVNVWDKGLVGAVEKAIRNSGLGMNPVVDGTILRLPIPDLNEERRAELAKVAGTYAENAKISKKKGQIGEVLSETLEVGCIDSSIEILEIQRQGKQPQKVSEFMLGSKIKKGSNLQNE